MLVFLLRADVQAEVCAIDHGRLVERLDLYACSPYGPHHPVQSMYRLASTDEFMFMQPVLDRACSLRDPARTCTSDATSSLSAILRAHANPHWCAGEQAGDWEFAADRPEPPTQLGNKAFSVLPSLAKRVIAFDTMQAIMPPVLRLLRLALSRLASQSQVSALMLGLC